MHELYISAISHLITLKLKVTFHKIYALQWFFIYLKSHLSFYQLSDLTRSRDFRIVKRIFVSKRCLELKQLESLIARHFRKHKFLNSYLFFFLNARICGNLCESCENKMQILPPPQKKNLVHVIYIYNWVNSSCKHNLLHVFVLKYDKLVEIVVNRNWSMTKNIFL